MRLCATHPPSRHGRNKPGHDDGGTTSTITGGQTLMWVLNRMYGDTDETDELRTVSLHATVLEAKQAADELTGQ